MASSSLSLMLLFALLLVFSHTDQVFGSQIESRKLKETNKGRRITYPTIHPSPSAPSTYGKCKSFTYCKRGPPGQKV